MKNDKITALGLHLKMNPEQIKELEELNMDNGSDIIETPDQEEYRVLTDEEADELWDEDLDNYIDDCILSELPEMYRQYFDNEKWKRDARFDGRGHSLNHYDGSEEVQEVDGVYYYIYRTN